ncbi:MFS transporter [Kitasatospora kifunensis]|uniref:MFS family permease n=1 Tax=Kitasatospora kifunensis TaxID=58351 RepID=A0A7W7R986_KITKI|nr:MFS transporter [Kitasatospora kifunensis]MBB4927649.1 MFS family permease [Kitasatospora kifunensis]
MGKQWLGLPRTRGAGPLLAAALVDSLGSGLFLPYAVLYFLDTTRVPLAAIGLALSAAAALALPCSALFGPLVDGLGARRSVALANAAQAAGFLGYLVAGSWWQIVAFGVLVNAGQNLFWTANGVLVTLVCAPDDRVRWFSLLRVVRNLGTGVGALLASLLAAGTGSLAGRGVVAANAGSFLLAAAVLARWHPRSATPADPPSTPADPASTARERQRVGYREVLADRRFAALNAATLLFALCLLGLPLILAVYVTRTLGQPAWVAGLLLAANTALIVALQAPVTEALRHHRSARQLQAVAGLFAASFALLWAAAAAQAGSTGWVALCLVAGMSCYTMAEIISSPVLTDLVAVLAPTGLRGRYFALSQLHWSLAGVLAPSLFSWLLNAGTACLWGVLLIVSCGAFLLAPAIDRTPGGPTGPPDFAPAPAEPEPANGE